MEKVTTVKMDNGKIYSVWVGASEVNNYYLTKQDAIDLAQEYKNDGYDDVIIRKEVTRD